MLVVDREINVYVCYRRLNGLAEPLHSRNRTLSTFKKTDEVRSVWISSGGLELSSREQVSWLIGSHRTG